MSGMYEQLVLAIVKSQEEIIGPIAWQQASTIEGLTISNSQEVAFGGDDRKQIIDNLVLKFRDFFGQAAIEVCKEAAHKGSLNISSEDLPTTLR